jgi:hypothetical protein
VLLTNYLSLCCFMIYLRQFLIQKLLSAYSYLFAFLKYVIHSLPSYVKDIFLFLLLYPDLSASKFIVYIKLLHFCHSSYSTMYIIPFSTNSSSPVFLLKDSGKSFIYIYIQDCTNTLTKTIYNTNNKTIWLQI